MGKVYYGIRDEGVNRIVVTDEKGELAELKKHPKISPAYLHTQVGWNWGEIDPEVKAQGDSRVETAWSQTLETARHLLSDVYGDMLADFNIRYGRYQAVWYYKKFAEEVLSRADDEWLLTEEEIRGWLKDMEHNRKARANMSKEIAVRVVNPSVTATHRFGANLPTTDNNPPGRAPGQPKGAFSEFGKPAKASKAARKTD